MTNALLGMLTVLVTTNFVGVTFTPIPCPHPGCTEGHHSYTATERYIIIRDTWAEVEEAPWKQLPKQNYRLYSDTNEWGSLSHPIAHPSVYHLHTQPGWPVRPGTRWPLDLPPLPPWEAYERARAPRRSSTTNLPTDFNKLIYSASGIYPAMVRSTNFTTEKLPGTPDLYRYSATGFYKNSSNVLSFAYKGKHIFSSTNTEAVDWLKSRLFSTQDTNAYGHLFNVTTNYPGYNLVIERRATDRSSGDRAYPGNAVERHFNPVTPYWPGPRRTNPPTIHTWGTQYHPTATSEVIELAPARYLIGPISTDFYIEKRVKPDEWILSYTNGPVTEWTNFVGGKLRRDRSATNIIIMPPATNEVKPQLIELPTRLLRAVPATNAMGNSRRFKP